MEVDGHLTPQQAALKAVMSSPAGRAQVEKALGTITTVKIDLPETGRQRFGVGARAPADVRLPTWDPSA
ncbi:hypothetical protein [Amycolatopsis vastitatis]|uniref:Uncharacterized protein n=1 Tax=Amycolatopsis vastitatis TaxID=1905142 RepID=A0A229SM16_9PSEU|nr:hypothetical protein [Amycolatopsis vastitatis]OXM60025.1 hypothetical protein CF165_44850 [Amycolatopsis vastitatis]